MINIPLYIDLPNNVSNVNEIQWKSLTFDENVKNKFIQYELCCVFYNYAVININYALTLILSKFSYNNEHISRVFRVAMWATLRSVDYGNQCAKNGPLNKELEQKSL